MFVLNESVFSSVKQDWCTPKWLFEKLNQCFSFQADVACDEFNALCDKYFTSKDDALKQKWLKSNYCNPPYKRKLQNLFVKKAHEEALLGNDTVMLLPARTDVKVFHDIILKNRYPVFLIKGRLKFSGIGTAPFPSMIVLFSRSFSLKNTIFSFDEFDTIFNEMKEVD